MKLTGEPRDGDAAAVTATAATVHQPAHQRIATPFSLGLAAAAVLALAVRWIFISVVDPHVPTIGDATAYHLLANNLAAGRGYIRPFDLLLLHKVHATAEYPPLFPAVVSVASWLGAKSVHAQRMCMGVVGTATVVVIGLVGRRVAGVAAGLTAAVIAAVYPMLFQSDATLMSETVFALLVATALLLAYQTVDWPTVARFVGLGAVIGCATLTRAEGGVLAVLLVVPLAARLSNQARRRRVLLGALGVGVAALVVVPWTLRNQRTFHSFVPVSTNIGTALEGANCRPVYSGPLIGLWRSNFKLSPSSPDACFTGFDVTQPHFNEARVAAQHRDRAVRYARHHATRLPAVGVARLLRTWGLFRPHQQINEAALEGRPVRWETIGTRMYWVLLVLAVGGLVAALRSRARVWPLLATVVMVSVSTLATYGNQRFRVGAEPAIVILAATGLVAGASSLRKRLAAT
jgi:4-amino-4-deoxy-L-arabinose transferase-like glycosyltransferase